MPMSSLVCFQVSGALALAGLGGGRQRCVPGSIPDRGIAFSSMATSRRLASASTAQIHRQRHETFWLRTALSLIVGLLDRKATTAGLELATGFADRWQSRWTLAMDGNEEGVSRWNRTPICHRLHPAWPRHPSVLVAINRSDWRVWCEVCPLPSPKWPALQAGTRILRVPPSWWKRRRPRAHSLCCRRTQLYG